MLDFNFFPAVVDAASWLLPCPGLCWCFWAVTILRTPGGHGTRPSLPPGWSCGSVNTVLGVRRNACLLFPACGWWKVVWCFWWGYFVCFFGCLGFFWGVGRVLVCVEWFWFCGFPFFFFFSLELFSDTGEWLGPDPSLTSLSFQHFYPLTLVQAFWIYLSIKKTTNQKKSPDSVSLSCRRGLKKKKAFKFFVLSRVVLQMSETLHYDSLS